MLTYGEAFHLMAEHARNVASVSAPDLAGRLREWADRLDAISGEDGYPRQNVARRDNAPRDAARAWAQTPKAEREQVVLDAIGDRRLTITEATAACNEALPDIRIYASSVGYVMRRLLGEGVLEREPEIFRNKPRYRYSKRKPMDDAISELDDLFGGGT